MNLTFICVLCGSQPYASTISPVAMCRMTARIKPVGIQNGLKWAVQGSDPEQRRPSHYRHTDLCASIMERKALIRGAECSMSETKGIGVRI